MNNKKVTQMKNITLKSSFYLIPFLIVMFFAGSFIFADSQKILPTASVTVHEENPDENFFQDGGPDRDAMTVRREEGRNAENYYIFDLSELDEDVERAHVNVFGRVTSGGSEIVQAFEVEDSSWDEETITWNNKPDTGDFITETEVGTGNAYWKFDLSEFVQDKLAEGETTFSIALIMEEGEEKGSFFNRGRFYVEPPFIEINSDEEGEPTRHPLPEDGYSSLYPQDWYPGFQDDEGRFLHDFSYAGYKMGSEPIPDDIQGVTIDVTEDPYNADYTGEEDATNAIQQAINDVENDGGGVVYLPEGTYKIAPPEGSNYALRITESNVVLRGDGEGKTFLYNTETYMRAKSIIEVAGEDSGWTPLPNTTSMITTDLLEPTSEIPVSDVSHYEAGDWVVISSDISRGFIEEHDMVGWWDNLTGDIGTIFYRQILDVDEENNTILIDIPTRYFLKMRDEAKVRKVNPPQSGIGIEHLSIGNKEHPGEGLENDAHTKPGTIGYEVHDSKMINFEGAVHSWVKNVSTFKHEDNETDVHILSYGIVLEQTRNISIVNSTLKNPQYLGGGGNGYHFLIRGNDNLIQNVVTENGRHNYSFALMRASGNVIHKSTSTDPTEFLDFHRHLSMSNLLDGMILNNDTIQAAVRPFPSNSVNKHGVTTAQSVMWNTTGNGAHPKAEGYIIDSRQFDYGYVIGTKGPASQVQTTPTIVNERDTSPEDFVEGEGEGDKLAVESLYEDQLEKKLSRENTLIKTLRVDGKPVQNFLLGKLVYDIELAYETEEGHIPAVTVESMDENAHVEIKDADAIPGTTEIVVTGSDGSTATYELNFTRSEEPTTIEELSIYPNKEKPGWRTSGANIEAGNEGHFNVLGILSDGSPLDLSEVDQVEYTSSDESVAIVDEDGVLHALEEGEATITVTVTYYDEVESASIDVVVKPVFPEPELPSLPIEGVSASDHDGNVPDNVIDGDPDTRWSAQGDGQWIMFDLGEPKSVGAVSIAYYSVRVSYFDIEVSNDQENWETVYPDGESSGESLDFETYEFDPVTARYVRFVGYGGANSPWNSITEFRAHEIHELIDVESFDVFEVPYGTSIDNLNLPETVEGILHDDSTEALEVRWDDQGQYDGEAPGTYTFIGTLDLPINILNPEGIEVEIEVKVLEESTEVDISVLEELIEEALSISNVDGKYTHESFTSMQLAIMNAQLALVTIETQVELENAIADLQTAIDELEEIEREPKPDLSELEELIDDALAINNLDGKYTHESFTSMQLAIMEAQLALVTIETQADLNEAITDLQAAIDGLEEVDS